MCRFHIICNVCGALIEYSVLQVRGGGNKEEKDQ